MSQQRLKRDLERSISICRELVEPPTGLADVLHEDLTNLEPRMPLLYFIELAFVYRQLLDRGLTHDASEAEVRRICAWLANGLAMGDPDAALLAPRNHSTLTVGGLEVRYESFWDTDDWWDGPSDADSDQYIERDLRSPFLEAIGRGEFRALLEQQAPLLRRSLIDASLCDDGLLAYAFLDDSEVLAASAAALSNHPERFQLNDTSFFVGRIAHALGPGPDSEFPGLFLRGTVNGKPVAIESHDCHGAGLTPWRASAADRNIARRALDALEQWLFSAPNLGHWIQSGHNNTSGFTYFRGARYGRLLYRNDSGDVPPWRAIAR